MEEIKMNVTILGGGIAGLTTAIGLAHYGISSTVLEYKSIESLLNLVNPRAIALNSSSKKCFVEFKIWDKIVDFCEPIKHIMVCNRRSDTNCKLDKNNNEPLGYIISGTHLYRAILQMAMMCDKINIISGVSYTDISTNSDKVYIHLSTGIVATDLCIVAEGRQSSAKQKFFRNQISKNYDQSAIVCNIEHTNNHNGVALEHFMPQGTFAALPLPDEHQSGIVYVTPNDVANRLAQLHIDDPIFLKEKMASLIGDYLGEIKILNNLNVFPLYAHISKNYFYHKVVLVSDSAHTIHPLAGQGLNVGIRDISYLCSMIQKYTSLGIEVNSIALRAYERTRKQDAYRMFLITDGLNRIFTSESNICNDIITFGLGVVDRSSTLKHFIKSLA
jgi:2-octaprenyl-6-methoxyphenol hydroxylase